MSDTELMLVAVGVESWERRPVAVDAIDQPSSDDQQYRLVTVNTDVVDQYAAAMERGERFPEIIVRENGGLVLLGGMHRCAAARAAGVGNLPAVVVTCTDAQARLISYEDNSRHGLPLSAAEKGEMAARLVELDGWSQAEAAARVGTTQSQVSTALAARRAHQRAVLAEVPARDLAKLDRLTLRTIGRLADEEVFRRAVRFAAAVRLPSSRAMQLVHRLQDAIDTDDALSIIREEEAIGYRQQRGGHGVRTDARLRFADALAEIIDCEPSDLVPSFTDDQARVIRRRLREAGQRIVEIGNRLDAR